MPGPLPAGYTGFTGPCGERAIALAELADELAARIARATLYQAAAAWGGSVFQGRAKAFEMRLGNRRVVVRHNWHGGFFAPVTGDRFLGDGRTEIELAASERLRSAGVPTPRVAAIVTYPAGLGSTRADVATELVGDARDLSAHLCDTDPASRTRAIAAAGTLLDLLAAAGARHHDLNVRNVLLRGAGGTNALEALVLDVDRVTFHTPHDASVMRGNVERLLRSARKWRRLHGARVTDAELAAWQARCTDASTQRPPRPR